MEIKRKALILPYNEKGEVLIQDRSNIIKSSIYMPWGYFGGSIEGDETPMQAVIRESYEEMTINVPENELVYLGEFESTKEWNLHIIRYVFAWKMKMSTEQIDLREGNGFRFVTPEVAVDLMTSNTDKNIALKFGEFIKK